MRTSTATTLNPFLNNPACTAEDSELVTRAKAGDQLEILLMRHLPWVFNLSVRMLHRRADAEDATQEILLKTIKALPGFRGEENFSTWVYRIAANHLLNIRKRKWAASDAVCSFTGASSGLRQVPDLGPPDPRTIPVPLEIVAQEVGNNCMIGTLLCLDGRQHLAYILGEVFQVSDQGEVAPQHASELLDSYMQTAANVYRGHPFYEPSEQAEMLRSVLPQLSS